MKTKRRILVVEDSATQAIALRAVLEEQGFDVDRASSGEEAVTRLEAKAYDLVLSDIVMPGMSGYDLCRHIKADEAYAAVPVVLLTSLTDPLDIVRGLECGADNYVTKPYEPEYLSTRIRHVLDRQRLRRNVKASLGVSVSFLGAQFSINSDKEQILDLFISSVEDVVRTNAALQESQRELAEAQARLEEHARGLAHQARASADRYATLMHEASDAILVLDVDGRILEANVRASELFGESTTRLRGRPLDALAAPGAQPIVRAQFERLRATNRIEAKELEFRGTGDGSTFWDLSASRSTNADETLIVAILHDVTELKLATAQLRKSEALMVQAQRVAMLGSWERDVRTGMAQWTLEVFAILGLDPTTTPASLDTFLAVVHPGDRARVAQAIHGNVETGMPMDEEFRIVRPDGTQRTVHARSEVAYARDGSIQMVRGTIQDVTDRKQLEEQLHQSQKMEAVGQLAGGIAHDFNNMLTVITSYCGIMLADLSPGDPQRADLEEISGAADRAAALTRQLLAFSRRQVLQPQVVDVNDLIDNLEKMLRRLIREDITFVTDLQRDIGVVWADAGQLEQVLMNLVVNARDAMPGGGRLLLRTYSGDYGAGLDATGEHACAVTPSVVIEISDTGMGMTPEVQARIFEPFFTTKPTGMGTGLGLSTVYGIVRQSSGEVTVDSIPGVGTTFRIYLPCGTGEAEDIPRRKYAAAVPHASGETVLVVEDDEALRAVAVRILKRHGYVVLEARNGLDALEQCGRIERPIDLVITDVVMPEMSGYELGQAITRQHPDTRVLLMSGYSRDVGVREGFVQGSSAYLEKPFTVDGLIAKVRDVLETPPSGEPSGA